MTRERFNWILTGLLIGIAFALLGVSTSNGEDQLTGQALVDHRVKGLKAAGGAMQFLSSYDGSDVEKAKTAAKVLDDLGDSLLKWFPDGSGPGGTGIDKTRAKAEIWANWADFEGKVKAFDDAAAILTNAAAGNDPAAIKSAVAGVGAACKACHEVYRGPED